MQPKSANNILTNRRHLFLSTSDFDRAYSDRWTRCITTPTIDEQYQYISLISAVIPNTIYTIQNEVNDQIILHFEWNNYYNAKDIHNFDTHFHHSKDINISIPQRNYTGKEILKIVEEKLIAIKWLDINSSAQPHIDEDPSHMTPIQKIDDQTDMFHFVNSGENVLEMSLKYFTHCGNNYITKLVIEFPNLAYKLFGADSMNKQIQVFSVSQEIAVDMSEFTPTTVTFPNQPSLLWVQFIQLRCDWVNKEHNSMVLSNIPITDTTKDFISFTNPQIEWTTKKMQYHDHHRMKISLSNEDGYALDIKNLPVYFEVILY